MPPLKRLSVVIPNHNYGHWIKDAILSVATDPYPEKQIICVDDGSTDDSWDVILKTGNMLPTEAKEGTVYEGIVNNTKLLAYHFAQAGGPSRTRNIGIDIGWNDSDFYGFLDADDVYLPGKIEKSLKIMMLDEQHTGACYTDYDTINVETGQRTRCYKEPYSKVRLQQECIVHSSCIVSKKAIELCGNYDESMRTAEDWNWWLRIAERFVITHIPEPLMLVRTGSYNSTATVPKSVWQENWQKISNQINGRSNAK